MSLTIMNRCNGVIKYKSNGSWGYESSSATRLLTFGLMLDFFINYSSNDLTSRLLTMIWGKAFKAILLLKSHLFIQQFAKECHIINN